MQVSTAFAGNDGCAIVSVTLLDPAVTMFPPASSTVTTGCCANAVPCEVVALGWVENTICDAAPTVIVSGVLVAEARPVVAVASNV